MKIYNRKSIRLKGYDYSQNGAYFITICTQHRECLFGEIMDGEMVLNEAGKIIENEWKQLFERFSCIELGAFVVMPNHFHGILIVENRQPQGIAPTDFNFRNVRVPLVGTQYQKTIGNIIGAFKSRTTNQYIHGVKLNKFPSFENRMWQRNYYEHIIRNEKSFKKISEYIIYNPQKWENDVLFEEY